VNNNSLLKEFPNKRVRAMDGMAVTADVWEDSHSFHRQAQRFHNLFNHGSGIVTGMEVIASDPADTSVYILPGVAVDTAGRMIAIAEPTAYDVGRQVEGLLHIVLTFGESRPRSDGAQSTQEGAPLYVHTEYGVQALPRLPDVPHIELARVRRQGRTAALSDARDADNPTANEIDLRWRRQNVSTVPDTLGVAVFYAGMTDHRYGLGVANLAQTVSQRGRFDVVVENNAEITTGLDDYGLVIVVAQRAFQLSPEEHNTLQAYVEAGGTVLFESSQRDGTGKPTSEQSFIELANGFGVQIADASRTGHKILKSPNLFVALPAGYDTGTPTLQAGGGVLISSGDYGALWQGERKSGPAMREEIRAAFELGENILHYAYQRQQTAASKQS
jgi:Domain of unknown function (DUF4159)